jgi:hypothetical protein
MKVKYTCSLRILAAISAALTLLAVSPVFAAGEPQITSITGVSNGGIYDAGELPQITVTASGDKIAKLEFYIDGVLSSTKNYALALSGITETYSLEDAGIGTHTLLWRVYDESGLSVSANRRGVAVTKAVNSIPFNSDFSGYKGNNARPDGIGAGVTQGGYFDAKTVDEEHGVSFALGINNPPVANQVDGAWLGIPMQAITSGKATVDFDFYISERPTTKEYNINFDCRGVGGVTGSIHNFGYIRNERIDIYAEAQQSGSALGNPVQFFYSDKTWYHIQIITDLDQKTYAVKITDATGAVVLNQPNGRFGSWQAGLSVIRIFSPFPDGENTVSTFMAIDNLVIGMDKTVPPVEAVTAASGDEVEGGAKIINVKLKSEIYGQSATKERITVVNEFGRIPVKQVQSKSNSEFVLTLESPLESGTVYRVIFDKTVELQQGNAFSVNMSGFFATKTAALDLADAYYQSDGSYVTFGASIANSTGESKDIFIISQVYSGNKIVRVYAKKETVASMSEGSRSVNLSVGGLNSGEYVKSYVFAGFNSDAPIALTKKEYRFR